MERNMKELVNRFMMLICCIAAISFTACSDDDSDGQETDDITIPSKYTIIYLE